MAASLASVPELAKKALSANEFSTRVLASWTWGSVWNRLLVCASSEACSATVSTQRGSPWPSALTAMPEVKSTYSRPSMSCTVAPEPCVSTMGVRP